MYAAKKGEGAPAWVLEELRAIGEKLKLALELGRKTPDTRSAIAQASLTPRTPPQGSRG